MKKIGLNIEKKWIKKMVIEFEEDKPKGRIIDMNEVSENRRKRNKEKIKSELTEDINDVLKDVLETFKKEKEKSKKKTHIIIRFFKLLGLLGLGFFILNFILFNVWVFQYFIKSIFMGG